ncbi:SDR family NAD(P)-dependent oxidoreductase [Phreatobacter sp.]|uniref:SDR family NAD(P)-dependent oxidoreductase n=1 Tax=Phreatobacter sp. TaxID=1966341 RepID=UPI003F7030E3
MSGSSASASRDAAVRHIVITGASRGIGRELALLYAAPNSHLTLIARSAGLLQDVAGLCRSRGATVDVRIADITDAGAIADALEMAAGVAGFDLLIANAGIGGADAMAGPAGEHPDAARAIASVNFLGVVNTIAPAIACMTRQGRGRIVIVGSVAGLVPLPSSPAYSAAKAGIRAYGIALDRLLRTSGVRVTVVSPGFVETDMSASLSMSLPFLVPAAEAARIIASGVERGSREIVFPWQVRAAAWFMRLLPDRVLVWIVERSQKKLVS